MPWVLLCLWLGCGTEDPAEGGDPSASPGSTDDSAPPTDGDEPDTTDTWELDPEPTSPPIVTRDDLPPCDQRTSPVFEDFDPPGDPIDREWAQYEDVLICPGDQLGFWFSQHSAWDGMDLFVVDGDAEGLRVAIGYRDPRTAAEATAYGFHIPRESTAKPCETATYPLVVRLAPDAAPVTFDLRVGPDTGERCNSTG